MGIRKTDLNIIERYFDDELSQKELDEFHSRLDSDPEFRSAFNDMELLLDGILYSAGQTSLEEKLQRIGNFFEAKEEESDDNDIKTPKFISFLWNNLQKQRVAVAAAVSAIVIASIMWLTLLRPISSDLLADKFFRLPEYSGIGITRGNESSKPGLDYRVFLAIENEEYAKAAALLDEAAMTNKNEEIILWAGIVHYLNRDYGKAESYYKKIIGQHGTYETEASWYLGLCYLKTHKIEEAKTILGRVVLSGTSRSEIAEKLLRKIKL